MNRVGNSAKGNHRGWFSWGRHYASHLGTGTSVVARLIPTGISTKFDTIDSGSNCSLRKKACLRTRSPSFLNEVAVAFSQALTAAL